MSRDKKPRPGSRRSPPAGRSPPAEAYDEAGRFVEEEPVDVADPPPDEDEWDDDPAEPAGDDPGDAEDEPGDGDEYDPRDVEDDDVEDNEDDEEGEHPTEGGGTAPRDTGTRAGASDDFGDSPLARPRPGGRGTFVPQWVMRACRGEPARMLVLAQLGYWLGLTKAGRPRARVGVPGDPYRWVVKTYPELGREVGLSVSQVRTALAGLVATGLVESRSTTFRGRLANALRIRRTAAEWAAQFDE